MNMVFGQNPLSPFLATSLSSPLEENHTILDFSLQHLQYRLWPATTTMIVAKYPPNQALTPKIPFNCNCPQAQYFIFFVYISCLFPALTSHLQPESCNAFTRSVKYLLTITQSLSYSTMLQCRIALCEMTLYIRPSVCASYTINDINKFACIRIQQWLTKFIDVSLIVKKIHAII